MSFELPAKSPLEMTDDEVRAAFPQPWLVAQALAVEERWGSAAANRVSRVVDGPKQSNKLAALFDQLEKARLIDPSAYPRKVGASGDELAKLLGSLGRQKEATRALLPPSLAEPAALPEPQQVSLLRQLIEHQRKTSEAAEAATEAQIAEAIESRRQARRTHRVTRAATAAGIMAGPLALYVAAVDRVPTVSAVGLGTLWVVAPLIAYFADRRDPILDGLDE